MNVLKTHVKRSAVKILATTEDLFEKLCYLTKLSWKAGEGTEISIDVASEIVLLSLLYHHIIEIHRLTTSRMKELGAR